MPRPNRWTDATPVHTDDFRTYAFSRLGKIISYSAVPFLARVVDVTEKDGEITTAYEPVSVEEFRQHYAKSLYHREADESDEDWRRTEIKNLCYELAQDSWFQGVPRDEVIYCHGCAEERPAHGSNLYDAVRLCNMCVERYEVDYAEGKTRDAQTWVATGLRVVLAQQAVKKAQGSGYVVYQLPDGRYAEVYTLYIRSDCSPYSGDQFREEHWPTGLIPTMFRVYIRSNMTEMADCEQEIVCTEAYKIGVLLAEGPEALLAQAEKHKHSLHKNNPDLAILLGWEDEE